MKSLDNKTQDYFNNNYPEKSHISIKNLKKELCHNKTMILTFYKMNKVTQVKKANKVKREIHRFVKPQLIIFLSKINLHCQIQLLVI